jgi:hypothetical protein
MNNLDLSVAIATAPASAYGELRERPRFWFPLLLLLVSTAAIIYWYYSVVDFEWFREAIISNNPDLKKLPEGQRAQAIGMYSRNVLLWVSVIYTTVAIPAILVLQSLYLLLAAKVTKLPQGFKHWFALSCWSALPVLLGIVVAIIFLVMSDTTQMDPSVIQPLSLNALVLHRPIGPGYVFFESLSIPGVLGWVLMIIGVRTWSQRSWAFSAIFVLLPVVIVYGIWSTFAFR